MTTPPRKLEINLQWHDYSINGTEDEEELVRLSPAEISVFLAGHVR